MKTLICAMTLLAGSTAQAATVHVDIANCPGPGDGSVGDPYCSIQAAIDNAMDTDEIVVAPGTYFETINFLGKAITVQSSSGPDVTVIDGTGNFPVVQCTSGEGPDTVLDGLTITGGNANGPNPDNRGGGMFILGSSPTVTDCTFSGNTADFLGGGLYNQNSSPTVTNCTFSGNSSGQRGGGMYTTGAGSPTVSDCIFTGNMADAFGGGIYNKFGTSLVVTGCVFIENTATFRAGAIYNQGSSLTVSGCRFDGNAAQDGGAMWDSGSTTVTDCTFTGNLANSGGGMVNANNSLAMSNCAFTGNIAATSGGAMRMTSASSSTFVNCTFAMNSGSIGQALAFDSSSSPNDSALTNCIVWNSSDGIWINDDSVVTIEYSDVAGGWPGTGNIDADPLFVDPDNGDYRLSAGSRCIDAGDNTAVPEGELRDLDGNPRFIDSTFVGTTATVDMGPYEFQRSVGRGPGMRDVLTLLGWSALPDFD